MFATRSYLIIMLEQIFYKYPAPDLRVDFYMNLQCLGNKTILRKKTSTNLNWSYYMKALIKVIFVIGTILSPSVYAVIKCPEYITCNYEEGTCDLSKKWHFNGGVGPENFGIKILYLSNIWGSRPNYPLDKYGAYMIQCSYTINGKNEGTPINIFTFVKKLMGNDWKYQGFRDAVAHCSSTNSLECAAET